jgi:hypothetical protein
MNHAHAVAVKNTKSVVVKNKRPAGLFFKIGSSFCQQMPKLRERQRAILRATPDCRGSQLQATVAKVPQ